MSKKSEAVKRWRKNNKNRMIEAFGGKCGICGYDKSNEVFDFHHLDPTIKEYTIGGVRSNCRSWDKTIIELRKCVMLCSNCHREVHAGVRTLPKNLPRFDENFKDYKEKKIQIFNSCPICGKDKPEFNITCSRRCAASKSWTVDWTKVDLHDLKEVKNLSYGAIGDMFGISDVAVRKRWLKIKKN